MHPLDTEYDQEARAQRQDAATEAAQHRNDAMHEVRDAFLAVGGTGVLFTAGGLVFEYYIGPEKH